MQVVIDITDEIYKKAKESKVDLKALDYLELAVKNGTALPEQHGRLIDADELKAKMHMNGYTGFATYYDVEKCFDYISDAPTIIEAGEVEKVTREEAIDFLECRRAYYMSLSTDPNPYVRATRVCGCTLTEAANAYLMAIEALKLMSNKEKSK